MKNYYQARLAVDMDGVLTNEPSIERFFDLTPNQIIEIYRTMKPNHQVLDRVRDWYLRNYHITIFTARSSLYEDVTKEWLSSNAVLYHELETNKLYYDHFLDDRATNSILEMEVNMGLLPESFRHYVEDQRTADLIERVRGDGQRNEK